MDRQTRHSNRHRPGLQGGGGKILTGEDNGGKIGCGETRERNGSGHRQVGLSRRGALLMRGYSQTGEEVGARLCMEAVRASNACPTVFADGFKVCDVMVTRTSNKGGGQGALGP
jgi:hypothetical protein